MLKMYINLYAFSYMYVYILDFCMNAFKKPNESFMKNLSTLFGLLLMSMSECYVLPCLMNNFYSFI